MLAQRRTLEYVDPILLTASPAACRRAAACECGGGEVAGRIGEFGALQKRDVDTGEESADAVGKVRRLLARVFVAGGAGYAHDFYAHVDVQLQLVPREVPDVSPGIRATAVAGEEDGDFEEGP